MYGKQEHLRFHLRTLDKLISVWFQVWNLPVFRSHRTEVRTLETQEDGMYFYPIALGAPVFAALIRGVRPVTLSISTGKLDVQLGLVDSTLHLYAWDPGAEGMLELVKQKVLAIRSLPKEEQIELGWEHFHIMQLLNTPYWTQILAGEMRSAGNFRWIAHGDATVHTGEFGAQVTPDFMLAGEGASFICYDRENDRLVGGTAAPDIWNKMKRES